jgi:hypothetical protein
VGSSKKLSGKRLVEYKNLLTLSKDQQDVLIGTILGDGNIRILKKEALLTVSHCEKQSDYVFWKYNVFRNWVLTQPRKEIRKYYKDRKRSLVSWRFSTISHSILSRYYDLFYPYGKKVIPTTIDSILISPLTLAVWYMDDGSRKPYGRGAFLHTESFSVGDQRKLITALKKNYSIIVKLASAGLSNGKRLFRLYITAKSFSHFRDLIFPYLLPSMQYKISL